MQRGFYYEYIVEKYINCSNIRWSYKRINEIKIREDIAPLYVRYDKKIIDEEVAKHTRKKEEIKAGK